MVACLLFAPRQQKRRNRMRKSGAADSCTREDPSRPVELMWRRKGRRTRGAGAAAFAGPGSRTVPPGGAYRAGGDCQRWSPLQHGFREGGKHATDHCLHRRTGSARAAFSDSWATRSRTTRLQLVGKTTAKAVNIGLNVSDIGRWDAHPEAGPPTCAVVDCAGFARL